MEYDIFISYSRKDSAVVQSVVDRLKENGYSCWMDVNGIESGDAFKRVLVQAIKKSKTVLFFSSADSNSSEWTVKEINIAVQLKKPIIPIRLDSAPYDDSIMFDLSGLDYIACGSGLSGDEICEKLLRSISAKVPKPSVTCTDGRSPRENAAGNPPKRMGCTVTVCISICLLVAFSFVWRFTVNETMVMCDVASVALTGNGASALAQSQAGMESGSGDQRIVYNVACLVDNSTCGAESTGGVKSGQIAFCDVKAGELRTINLPGGVPMRFRGCPPGEFRMGSPVEEKGHRDDEIQRTARITRGFWIGEYEVTQQQWEHVMDGETIVDLARKALKDEKEYFGDKRKIRDVLGLTGEDDPVVMCKGKGPNMPVYWVSWENAVKFCQRLTAVESVEGRIPVGYEYRLPTEAEWEYACRAETTSALPSGSGIEIVGTYNAPALDPIAWYGGNAGVGLVGDGWDMTNWEGRQYMTPLAAVREVGLKRPNRWGIYDMIGNVWEWCLDWYEQSPPDNLKDPSGPDKGIQHVRRGGGWSSPASLCRSASRMPDEVGLRYFDIGFRVVLAPCITR